MARVLFEAVVRGLWLRRCASTEELEGFKMGLLEKSFHEISEEVDKKLGMNGYASLRGIKSRSWSNMNDFTHTGIMHVSRRLRPETIEANYKDAEIASVLGIATRIGTMARLELIQLAKADELIEEVLPHLAKIISPSARQKKRNPKVRKR